MDKIIFLDIDGVLLSGKALLLPQNKKAKSTYNQAQLTSNERHTRLKKYALSVQFDPCAVALINRLAKVTGAKIVVQSNWRRNIGFDETKQKLVEQGINPDYFHEDWCCPIRGFSSQKIHDMYEWMSNHGIDMTKTFDDFGLYQTPYIVIDDEVSWEHYRRGFWIQTDYTEGFDANSYRMACALLGFSDPRLSLYVIEQDVLDTIEPYFDKQIAMANWLYEKRLDGYTVTPAALLSRQAAIDANKNGIFLGGMTDKQLYQERSSTAMSALVAMCKSSQEKGGDG